MCCHLLCGRFKFDGPTVFCRCGCRPTLLFRSVDGIRTWFRNSALVRTASVLRTLVRCFIASKVFFFQCSIGYDRRGVVRVLFIYFQPFLHAVAELGTWKVRFMFWEETNGFDCRIYDTVKTVVEFVKSNQQDGACLKFSWAQYVWCVVRGFLGVRCIVKAVAVIYRPSAGCYLMYWSTLSAFLVSEILHTLINFIEHFRLLK